MTGTDLPPQKQEGAGEKQSAGEKGPSLHTRLGHPFHSDTFPSQVALALTWHTEGEANGTTEGWASPTMWLFPFGGQSGKCLIALSTSLLETWEKLPASPGHREKKLGLEGQQRMGGGRTSVIGRMTNPWPCGQIEGVWTCVCYPECRGQAFHHRVPCTLQNFEQQLQGHTSPTAQGNEPI